MDKIVPRNREFSSEERGMIDAMTDLFGKVPLLEVNSAQDVRRFTEAFINAAKAIDLKDYALKPNTFPSGEFSITSDVNMYFKTYFHSSMTGVITDAPFVYALEHSTNAESPIIGVIAFRVDMERRLLLIEQIQGGDTQGTTPMISQARRLFRNSTPEYALYDAIRQFALSCNFRAIGIRKGIANFIQEFRENAKKRADIGKETIYERVAAYAKHEQNSPFATGEFQNYTFESLLTREQTKY